MINNLTNIGGKTTKGKGPLGAVQIKETNTTKKKLTKYKGGTAPLRLVCITKYYCKSVYDNP